jgi:Arc/MetJ-type ribon-helix-helix transcriptional regulator
MTDIEARSLRRCAQHIAALVNDGDFDEADAVLQRALRAAARATAEECAQVAFMEQPMIPCGELDDAVCRACDNIAAAIRTLADRIEGERTK